MTTTTATARAVGRVTLKPFRQRYWLPIVGSLVAAVAPVYATAFVIASTGGHLVPVSVAAGITLVAAAVVAWRFSRARLVLHAGGITEYCLLTPPRRTPRADVTSALLLAVYDGQSLQARRRLFLLDAEGRTLLRMSGGTWSDAHMSAVIRHFDVLVETVETPMTLRELRLSRRPLLRWTEQHPFEACVLQIAVGLACCVVVAVTATLTIS